MIKKQFGQKMIYENCHALKMMAALIYNQEFAKSSLFTCKQNKTKKMEIVLKINNILL